MKLCNTGSGFRCLLAAVSATLAGSAYGQSQSSPPTTRPLNIMLGALSDIEIASATAKAPPFTALPMNSPPINGFVPQVVFGLTNQQAPQDATFAARPSSVLGTTMPVGLSPHYETAIFDTGSQSHLIKFGSSQPGAFDLNRAPSREGLYTAQIIGASGVEEVVISDGLGIYMTSLSNATVTNGTITSATGMKGQWNTSILVGEPGSILPNIIGAPMVAQYQTVIRNSQTRHIVVGGETVRSPTVSFQTLNTPIPQNYYRLTLDVLSPSGVAPDPTFFPDLFSSGNNFANNPTTPTFWGSLFANTSVAGNGSATNQQFLFDTGAQVTVVSQDTAAACGFFSAGENPSTPDFFVEVTGVGGSTTEVPGFYMQTLSVLTNGGTMTWTNVPVVVLDITDPRDGIGFVPGILGMNLFTDRDLVVNGGTTNPFVGISPAILSQWTANGGGTWSDDLKWSLGSPDGADVPANFLSAITGDSVVNVPSPVTLGTMKFDSVHRYTLTGPGTINFEAMSLGQASITVASGSHTVDAPINLISDTNISVIPVGSTLTVGNGLRGANATVNKMGQGTVETLTIRTAGLNVMAGKVKVTPNGTTTATSVVKSLLISQGAQLDLTNNSMIVDYETLGTLMNDISSYRFSGRLISSLADGERDLGFADNATLGKSTFGGQDVDSTSVLITYTYVGDANLDGMVDRQDLLALATNWTDFGYWNDGDFNRDGLIDGGDLLLLARNWMMGTGVGGQPVPADTLEALGLPTAVPEPATLGLAAVILAGLTARVRARKPLREL